MKSGEFQHASRDLIDRTANRTGDAYYSALAHGLVDCLGFEIGLVGHQVVGNPNKVRVRASSHPGVPPRDYELDGTFLADVVSQRFSHHPSQLRKRFPKDEWLHQLGVESAAGSCVGARASQQCGLVIALNGQPTAHLPEELASTLGFCALRTSAEYQHERLEHALSSSEARYRGMISDTLEGLWAIDGEGVVTFANLPMAEMLGYRPEEMIGRHAFDFMDRRAQADVKKRWQRRREGVQERFEFRYRHKDGSDVWTIMTTAPVHDGKGRFIGLQAIVTDLTERQQLHARVLQAQKLESLGMLAGGIAHDFNNLLVGILGNASLALGAVPSGSPALTALQEIEDSAMRLADLTRQLLAYAGKGRFLIDRIDLNAAINKMSHLLSTVISPRARLKLELSSAPVELDGDANQLGQVLMNLITNASDALEGKDGTIRVATRRVEGDCVLLHRLFPGECLEAGAYAYLEVSDDGTGMDEETLKKVFDPFFTTRFAGRGLGLPAVQGIVRSHRGVVRVDSEPGKGTSIKLLFPLAGERPAPPIAQPSAPDPPALSEARVVMIADDEEGVRKFASRLLERAGFEVLQARDGQEAVELIDQQGSRISSLLLDLTMPRLSGEEVLAHVRKVAPGIRVILSSGYSESMATERVEGISGFLPKPWTPEQLRKAFGQ